MNFISFVLQDIQHVLSENAYSFTLQKELLMRFSEGTSIFQIFQVI